MGLIGAGALACATALHAGHEQRIDSLLAQAVQLSRQVDPQGKAGKAGLAVPGIRDASGSTLLRSHHLPALQNVDLRAEFSAALQRAVCVDSDVNAAAWAQHRASPDRPDRFAYVSIGTGLGGAIVLHDTLVRLTAGGAGHFGLLIVDPAPAAAAAKTGVAGSLEAAVAGVALQDADDAALQRGADRLAVGLAQLVAIYRPDLIALGGGVVDQCPRIAALAQAAVHQRIGASVLGQVPVRTAPLDSNRAGVLGAALLAAEPEQD